MASIRYNERIRKYLAVVWLGQYFEQNQVSKVFESMDEAIEWTQEIEQVKKSVKNKHKRN